MNNTPLLTYTAGGPAMQGRKAVNKAMRGRRLRPQPAGSQQVMRLRQAGRTPLRRKWRQGAMRKGTYCRTKGHILHAKRARLAMQNVPFYKTAVSVMPLQPTLPSRHGSMYRTGRGHLLPRKKSCISRRQSPSSTPAVTVALGCRAPGA